MDLTKIALDIIEAGRQVACIILRKPFLAIKIQSSPNDVAGKEAGRLVTLTVANESSGDIDVKSISFLTSFNRSISSEVLDGELPASLKENDRVAYTVPIAELKAALNQTVGETITEVVVSDQAGRDNVGRFDKATQGIFSS